MDPSADPTWLLPSSYLVSNRQSKEAPEQHFTEKSRTKSSLITSVKELGQTGTEAYNELRVMVEVAVLDWSLRMSLKSLHSSSTILKAKTRAFPYLSACKARLSLRQRSQVTLLCRSFFPPNMQSRARRVKQLLAPRFPRPSRHGRCSHSRPPSSTHFIFPCGQT